MICVCVCAQQPNQTNRRTTETESIFTHNNSIQKKLNEEQTTDQKNNNNNEIGRETDTHTHTRDPQFNK